MCKAFLGGEFDLCLGGVGKLNQKHEFSNNFFVFFWAVESLTAIDMCLDKMEELR